MVKPGVNSITVGFKIYAYSTLHVLFLENKFQKKKVIQ